MTRWRTAFRDERGVALVLSLMVLLTLTGLVLAFLSVGAMEPQISRNLGDTLRARYLAEAGLEAGFNALIALGDVNGTWTTQLAGATAGNPWRPVPNLTAVTLPGLSAAAGGTFTVSIRNDYNANDSALTGEVAPDANPTADANRVVFMRATSTFNGATKTLEVVVKRSALPPFPGAVNIPGTQADTFVNTQVFDIDGRDYSCSSNCDNENSWNTGGDDDDSGPAKYAMAVNTGTQSNVGVTYESRVESAFGTSGSCSNGCSNNKKNSLHGKDQTDPSSTTTGLNTIAADSSMNPSVMQAFLSKLAANSGTTILQSTMACPMILMGNSSDPSKPTLRNDNGGTGGASCDVNRTLDLGTRTNPKLVYFRGELDTSSTFTGLQLNSASNDPIIRGAGILVIEDGDLRQMGKFAWDGIVIVTGRYVGAGFRTSSDTDIRGAFVALETQPGEASGFFEFYLDALANKFSVRNSMQNINRAQFMRALHTMSSWREI